MSWPRWRADLVADLGGPDAITTQQAAVVDLSMKTKLILDSVDVWILTQPSLINVRRNALLPVVRERQILADALARYMTMLGLERRPRKAPGLGEYVRERYGAEGQTPTGAEGQTPTPQKREASV